MKMSHTETTTATTVTAPNELLPQSTRVVDAQAKHLPARRATTGGNIYRVVTLLLALESVCIFQAGRKADELYVGTQRTAVCTPRSIHTNTSGCCCIFFRPSQDPQRRDGIPDVEPLPVVGVDYDDQYVILFRANQSVFFSPHIHIIYSRQACSCFSLYSTACYYYMY